LNFNLNIGIKFIGRGLIELMHVIYILSVGVLAYYLVNILPIDHIVAILLSVGAGLWAAYRVYGASNSIALSASNEEKAHKINFDDMNHSYSHEADNIYFFDKD